MIVETETIGIARDTNSRALLAINVGELQRHRGHRNIIKRLQSHHTEQSSQIQSLVHRLDHYEILLQELMQHIDNRR